jgi:hypothetical protein
MTDKSIINIKLNVKNNDNKKINTEKYDLSHNIQLEYINKLFNNNIITNKDENINIVNMNIGKSNHESIKIDYPPKLIKPNLPLSNDIIYKNIFREIKKKKSGYLQQDKKKFGFFNITDKISFDEILFLLYYNQLKCHYCKKELFILFIKKRHSYQWTLDRINNNIGHSYNNCIISCLKCNLQRRIKGYNRFKNLKQFKFNIIK